MLCIDKDGADGDLTEMYDLLIRIIDNSGVVAELIKAKHADQIASILNQA
jgi:mannitol/fructose-specific phosphotransferase system IIA component (Ntr-type)